MLIKFKEPDPRAGATVRMDSSRGQYFIDTGAADAVSEQPQAELPEPVTEETTATGVAAETADAVSEQPAGKKGRQGKAKA
ncbi:hypothetical protein [Stenotrophomonas maltophilia]|uniref:hypothetical protein n=1 Tax=Stenotrophomonas maltophilia TaxID=40324 RepID=UPI0015DF1D04|nr:hypothetical protein [Stenotrophomonas maltophilia]MBA0361014.1 hypothetical protein [Stenotrophomonas maltophilia]